MTAAEASELLAEGKCFACLDDLQILRKQAALLALIAGNSGTAAELFSLGKCFDCATTRQLELIIAQLMCDWLNEGPCEPTIINDAPCLQCASWKQLAIIQTQLLCDIWGGDCDGIGTTEQTFCCVRTKKMLRVIIAQLICEIKSNPPTPGQVSAGNDQNVCETGTVQLMGTANGTTGWTWTTSGDGTFDDNTILNPVYTPGAGDIAAGTVTLTITSAVPVSNDSMVVTLFEVATADAGPDQTTEGQRPIQLAGSIGGSATTGTWSGGTGTFDDVTALDAIYTPSEAEALAGGNVVLTLTSDDPDGPCPPASDTMTLSVTAVCDVPNLYAYWTMDEPAGDAYRQDGGASGFHLLRVGSLTAPAGKLGAAAAGGFTSGIYLIYNDAVAADVAGPDVDNLSLGYRTGSPPDNLWENTITFWFKIGDPFGVGEQGTQVIMSRFGLANNLAGYARWEITYSRGIASHGFNLRYWRQDEVAFQDIIYPLDGNEGRLSDIVADTWYFAAIRRKSDAVASFFIGDVGTMALSKEDITASLDPRYSPAERVPFIIGRRGYDVDPAPLSAGSQVDEVGFYRDYAATDEEIECLFNDGAGRRPLGLLYWLAEVTVSPEEAQVTQEVTLAHPDSGAQIFYTLDGTLPTTSDTLYSVPFDVTDTAWLRARAFKVGFQPSINVGNGYYGLLFGMLAYWPVDETSDGSTNVTRVDVRSTHDMTSHNTIPSAAGHLNNAVDLENANLEWLDTPSFGASLTKMTVMGWIKEETVVVERAIIAKWAYQTQGCWAFQTSNSSASDLMAFIATSLTDDGSGCTAKSSLLGLVAGTFYHIAWVYDGTAVGNANRLKLFVDGVAQTLTFGGTVPASLTASSAFVRLGDFENLSRFWDGLLDEFGIWNRPLSQAEMDLHRLTTVGYPTFT